MDGAASLTGGEYHDVQAKTDASSLNGLVLPAPPHRLTDTTTPRSPSSVREFLREDRQLDVTFTQAFGPAGEPSVGGEEEPDKYSKPEAEHNSGSEHSSQKSFKFSCSKTFQTQSSHPKSNSNSHRSNGSHGYSFNNSYAHSQASYSNGSHSALSVSSSVSNVISDKAESVGSVASRNREKERLVTVGQSGSEGKAYPGRETLEQIRSLGSLGGQSDDESF